MSTGPTTTLRSKLGNLTKELGPYDPAIIECRQDLAEATIAKRVAEIVAKAPPLRPDQVERLSVLLRSGSAR